MYIDQRPTSSLLTEYGKYGELINELKKYTERMVRKRIEKIPKGEYEGEDYIELDHQLARIRVRVKIGKEIKIDFSGSSKAMRKNINAPLAVTYSSVYFFFRTFLGSDVPINSEFYKFFNIIVPENSILNPPRGYPVVAGNVETSQRIVDALILAFSKDIDMPAQSHGTMNNVSMGNERFTYYETIGGGAGAFKNYSGEDGIHVYMTNTKNTPVEIIESSYPLICEEYGIGENSGGGGRWRGGNGIIKRYKVLEDCTFSILSDRRKIAPRGMKGGKDGKKGINIVIRRGKRKVIGSKATLNLKKGDEIIIMTPGGGGYEKD